MPCNPVQAFVQRAKHKTDDPSGTMESNVNIESRLIVAFKLSNVLWFIGRVWGVIGPVLHLRRGSFRCL